jgi:hypothetical protein
MRGGAVIAHKARLLIACGGEGKARPLPYIQSNACRFLFLLFSYLRFAEAASFDKKELRRSCTVSLYYVRQEMHSFSMRPAKYLYDQPLPKYLDPKTVLIYRLHLVFVVPFIIYFRRIIFNFFAEI